MASGPARPGGDRVRIGRVGKTHGNAGGVYLETPSFPGVLAAGVELHVGGRDLTVVSVAGMPQRPLVEFQDLNGRDAAARLRDEQVWALRRDLPPLADGEWYGSDLEGLAVVDRAGHVLGTVARILNAPSTDVLEVRASDGSELLVPLGDDAVVELSVADGRVVVDRQFLGLGDGGHDGDG